MTNSKWFAALIAVMVLPSGAQTGTTPLTLEEAWRRAEERNVSLVAARAAVVAAEGQEADARAILWNNPEISAERLQRRASQGGPGTERIREWSAGVSQALEIGGQAGFRRRAAAAELDAARWQLLEARIELRAEVERRFVQVLALQLRLANERESVELIERSAAVAARRVEAGEDNRLDGNVARVEAGRARSQLQALSDQLAQAQAQLGEVLQSPPREALQVAGDLDPRELREALDGLLTRSRDRPQRAALASREAAATNRLGLERASRMPDITVGLTVAREGSREMRESVAGINVSVPLPLFRRNAGPIALARANLSRLQAERQAGERDIEASIRSLWERRENLRTRVRSLQEIVLPALTENQRLSQRALQEGEIALGQLVLVNRQALEGRRELYDAMTELRLLHVAIEQAAGIVPGTRVP